MKKIILAIGIIGCYLSTISQTAITYLPSTNDFANPERGFYRYSETRSNSYTLLIQDTLESYRQLHAPDTANYSIYSTLVYRYFFLEDFKTSEISQDYLDNMQTDFNTVRLAGVKLIIRFAYTDEVNSSGCPNWICPPYGDASKDWVLTHINQLEPLLQSNKDVIAAVQIGFIGVWGENYYTDYFGDASQPPNQLLDSNWVDRIEVLDELLDAVPIERMVQVRYPQKKQRAIYGVNALTDSAPLTIGEAYTGTNKSRIGFHNDCLLASPDDYGTYFDYGNSSSGAISDTSNLKPYFADDSKFVVVGGETCDDNYSPQNDCASTDPAAYGDTEIERMHYSYLNAHYNNGVNNDWTDGGCMDEIKKRLGYRFELQTGSYSNAANPNQIIAIDIDLKNNGFATLYNERGLELILRDTATDEVWFAPLSDDPRFWLADSTTYHIAEELCIPNDMPLGTYELLLNLPDPMPTLYASPEYAIRLANLLPDNSEVWEPTTGFNKLGHFITIDVCNNNPECDGEIVFNQLDIGLPVSLTNFTATPDDQSISLKWTTSSEYNNAGFYIERSTDGIIFKKVVWVEGKGTLDLPSHYSFSDTKIAINTVYYYRLAQIDLDGSVGYSKTVSAQIDLKHNDLNKFIKSILIYPNPTFNGCTIRWDDGVRDHFSAKIINIFGREISNLNIINNTYLDLSFLPQGIYFIEFKVQDRQVAKRIIKY